VSPLRGEKPQNWPLSKLNTGRFALRAMLPVIIQYLYSALKSCKGYRGFHNIVDGLALMTTVIR